MKGLWVRRRKKGLSRYRSVLDLGASSVKALVVELGERVTIWGRARAKMEGLEHPLSRTPVRIDILVSACEQALRQAEDATESLAGEKIVPDEVLMGISGTWVCGAMGSGLVQREQLEMGVTSSEYPESIALAGRRAMRNLGRLTGPGQWELVDAMLVTFSIDGRPVTDPLGFRGYVLGATVFVAAAPRKYLRTLDEIADRLQLEPPHLVPQSMSLAASAPGNGLIVEAGASSTDVCVAHYGAPLACGSVPTGGNVLTQVLMDTFKLSPPRARALKRAYSVGQLSADGALAVRTALAPAVDAWISRVVDRVAAWRGDPLVWSPDIYLCGGMSLLPGTAERMSQARWLEKVPFPHAPNVSVWDGSTVSQVDDRTQSGWRTDEVVALSLAAWTARDQSPSSPDGLLRSSLGID
jgi:hypothetical protein